MGTKTRSDAFRFDELPDSIVELCRLHPPRPIHDSAELEQATAIIDAMAGHDLNDDQEDYLDTISTLVEQYEAEHDPVDTSDVTGSALLSELMQANELTAADVARIIDADRTLVQHILAGRRALTWDHAKALGERFALPPAAFMD